MEHGQLTSDSRRWAAAITLAGLAVATVALPAPAFAKDPKPGKELCEVTDERLGELSGLVATDSGYAAIGDGTDGNVTQVDVVQLDDKCQVTGTVTGMQEPADPEDLAVDGEGNFWVADTGDNGKSRPTIALHKIAPDGTVTLFRFSYPDGEKFDCEALLLQPDGTPIFATKDIGVSNLFAPDGKLDSNNQQAALKKVGSVKIKSTKTDGGPEEVGGIPLGDAPSMFVTGGAVSKDGKKAVLRTYTDAYEWTVKGKDVAKSIKDGKPAVTPLPKEPQGEAITYSTDGKKFVTGSEAAPDGSQQPKLWSYTPAKAAASSDKKKDKESEESGQGLLGTILDTLGPTGILWVVAGIGVIGLIMVVIGGRVILRARKRGKGHSLKESLDGEQPRYRDQNDGFGGGKLFEPVSGHRQGSYEDDRYDEPRSGSVYGGGRDYDESRGGRDYDEPRGGYDRYDEPRSGSFYGGGGGRDYDEPRGGRDYDEPRSGSVYGGYDGGPRGGRDDEPNTGTVYGGRR